MKSGVNWTALLGCGLAGEDRHEADVYVDLLPADLLARKEAKLFQRSEVSGCSLTLHAQGVHQELDFRVGVYEKGLNELLGVDARECRPDLIYRTVELVANL